MLARRAVFVPSLAALVGLSALTACGGTPPPSAPVAKPEPPKPSVPPEPQVDVSEVAEPPMMIGLARVKNAEASMKVVNGWLRLPLLDGRGVLNEVFDADVAEVFDTSAPVDAALAVGGSILTKPAVYAAVALPVKSIEAAKAKLAAAGMQVSAKADGQFLVEGIGKGKKDKARPEGGEEDEETSARRKRREEKQPVCVLAPAAPAGTSARLVCGEPKAVEALGPWLARTAPRRSYASDVHLELRPLAVRDPLLAVRSMLPAMTRSFAGSSASPAELDIVEAGASELMDLATDVDRVTMDATIEPEGVSITSRVDHGKTASVSAQLAVAHPERAGAPPAAFWRLPGDTELAAFGRGADPKPLERPRKLLSALVVDELGKSGLPEPERKAFEDLLGNRSLPLFLGPMVYGKGTSEASLVKAKAALAKVRAAKTLDKRAEDKAELELAGQAFGWHLANLEEPISKVGPVLRDWSTLWARPGLAKWKKDHKAMDVSVKVAAAPAGVKLPKDALHLEFVVKRAPQEERKWDGKDFKVVKKWTVDPVVFHVVAVPDAGSTWVGLGFDAKLVAERAAAALGGAPEKDTLATKETFQGLRQIKASSGVFATLRAFTSIARIDGKEKVEAAVASMPSKGATVIPMLVHAEAPGPNAAAGSAVTTIRIPRAVLEDGMRLGMGL